MQDKMKMNYQKDENMVQVQQQCSVYFCIRNNFRIMIFLADMAF